MNSRNKIIRDILSTYNNILENKCIIERAQDLRNTLKSLGYSEKGSEISSGGEINSEISNIVSEILKEYKKTNPDVNVIVTGGNDKYHQGLSYNSKHKTGNAIDVTIEPYTSKNANDFITIVKQFIQKYPKLAFMDEYTNPSKASTGKHFHLEFNSEGVANNNISKTTDTNTTSDGEETSFARQIGKSLLSSIGINETLDYKSLGNKVSLRSGDMILPKESNPKIKSLVSGVISNYFNSCDGLTIKFEDEGKIFYINYCGIESTDFRVGQKIKKGDIISYPKSDVRVSIYNSKGKKEYTNMKTNIKTKSDSGGGLSSLFISNKSNSVPKKDISTDYTQYKSEIGRELIKMKDNLFKVNKKDKLEENIKRIKGLL